MNPWRVILTAVAILWILPMYGLRREGFPTWFFFCIGLFWLLVCMTAGPLYDWGTDIRRKLGMRRLADFAERNRPQLLPAARIALAIMAAISFAAAIW